MQYPTQMKFQDYTMHCLFFFYGVPILPKLELSQWKLFIFGYKVPGRQFEDY